MRTGLAIGTLLSAATTVGAAPAAAQDGYGSTDFTAYVSQRMLRVTARCAFRYVTDDGNEVDDRAQASLVVSEDTSLVHGSVAVISDDGFVLGTKHIFAQLFEKIDERVEGSYGTAGDPRDPLVEFFRVCEPRDVELTFERISAGEATSFRESRNDRWPVFDSVAAARRERIDAFVTRLADSGGVPIARASGTPFFCIAAYAKDRQVPTIPVSAHGYLDGGTGPQYHQDSGVVDQVLGVDSHSTGMTAKSLSGMSGGPVLDRDGYLVGINRARETLHAESGTGTSTAEISRFVPVNVLWGVVPGGKAVMSDNEEDCLSYATFRRDRHPTDDRVPSQSDSPQGGSDGRDAASPPISDDPEADRAAAVEWAPSQSPAQIVVGGGGCLVARRDAKMAADKAETIEAGSGVRPEPDAPPGLWEGSVGGEAWLRYTLHDDSFAYVRKQDLASGGERC